MSFVDDPRHRFSYELRPDLRVDRAVRGLAELLEADGLLPEGASTAARFQPHLTLLRADHADAGLVDELARRVGPQLELAAHGSFGGGRIAWLAPAEAAGLRDVRSWLVGQLGVDHVDPLALARDPWVPHVTVGYAIDEPHRAQVAARMEATLPVRGAWATVDAWDLDARPTVRVASAAIS